MAARKSLSPNGKKKDDASVGSVEQHSSSVLSELDLTEEKKKGEMKEDAKDDMTETKKDEKEAGTPKTDKTDTAKSRTKLDPKDEKLRATLRNLVANLFLSKYTKQYYPFKYRDVVRLLVMVKHLFRNEPVMVECRLPVVVVGDIHGQFADLQRVFTIFSDNERLGCYNQRFIFLGDYVDRGRQSMECVMLVFVLKILFPSEFILLRGNHEMRPINMVYGFLAELEERYDPKEANTLFQYFNAVFSFMPLCCIAGDNILCMHGGICPEMTSRDVFKGIPKPLLASCDNPIAESLLWADPMIGEPRCRPNKIRGLAVHFGEPLVDEICEKLGVKLIVRGHQMMMNGFKFFNGHKLVTVFTASHYYPQKLNHGAVMVVDATGRCGFRIIVPAKVAANEKVFRGEHEKENEHMDNGYQTNPDLIVAKGEESVGAQTPVEGGAVRKRKTAKRNPKE